MLTNFHYSYRLRTNTPITSAGIHPTHVLTGLMHVWWQIPPPSTSMIYRGNTWTVTFFFKHKTLQVTASHSQFAFFLLQPISHHLQWQLAGDGLVGHHQSEKVLHQHMSAPQPRSRLRPPRVCLPDDVHHWGGNGWRHGVGNRNLTFSKRILVLLIRAAKY